MENSKDSGKVECARITDAVPKIFSGELMPDIAPGKRNESGQVVLGMEGSADNLAMTCVPEAEFPQLALEFRAMIWDGSLEFGYGGVIDAVRGRLRGLNVNCDECSTEGCGSRVNFTKEIRERMFDVDGAYTSPRIEKAKAGARASA